MTADVRVEIGGAALARPVMDPICAVYDEVFSAPPFFWREDESELHRQRLLRLLDDPAFGVVVARVGEELVGFAYGFRVPPDTTRWQGLRQVGQVEGGSTSAAPVFDVYLRDSLDDLRMAVQATP